MFFFSQAALPPRRAHLVLVPPCGMNVRAWTLGTFFACRPDAKTKTPPILNFSFFIQLCPHLAIPAWTMAVQPPKKIRGAPASRTRYLSGEFVRPPHFARAPMMARTARTPASTYPSATILVQFPTCPCNTCSIIFNPLFEWWQQLVNWPEVRHCCKMSLIVCWPEYQDMLLIMRLWL